MDEDPNKTGDPPPEPIECRAAVAIEAAATNEIVYMPAGVHAITPVSGGIGRPIKVLVDPSAAGEIEKQRAVIHAKTGKRVYFDFNHEDGPASFWPESFTWRANEGVVAKGEWSASGKRAVEGKDFRAFSPVFHVDDKRKDPSRVVCCEAASPNMGGLVNDPAFSNLPLWAKNAGITPDPLEPPAITTKQEKVEMTPEEIAALQAKKEELEAKVAELTALVSKDTENDTAKSQLDMLKAQAEAAEAELKAAALKAQNEVQAKEIEKRNKIDAEAAVKAAVKRGAILAKDLALQNKLITQATADPGTWLPVIAGMQGRGGAIETRLTSSQSYGATSSGVATVNDDPVTIYAKMARILSDSARTGDKNAKARLGEEFGALFASSFKDNDRNRDMRTRLINTRLEAVQDAIMAADITDANLGTIAGTLVTQRTLELLKFVFPSLVRFTTDFSSESVTYGQTVMTRIVTIPSVVTYSTASGWTDVTAATTDVPVVINNHKGVPITFGENLLASTMRKLFDEFAEASAYALAKALVDSIYALFTDANYTNNSVFSSANFNRAAVVDIGTALTTRGVPLGLGNRTMLLWPAAFGSLVKDTTLVTYAAYQQPNIITEGAQPNATLPITVDTFQVYTSPNMPSNNANLVGFAGSKSAVVIATRTPNDYTSVLPGASFGNVQMVTDPDIGITVMQVQYVNHTLGTATSRIALMWGTAAGQTAAGQLIKANTGSGSSR